MQAVNQKAEKVLTSLVDGLNDVENYKKVGDGDTYMDVSIEVVGEIEMGKLISVAHYYKQNGDLMKDPEMVFIHDKRTGKFYPCEFYQDGGIPIAQNDIILDENLVITGYYKKRQKDHAVFAGIWMQNIKDQQGL